MRPALDLILQVLQIMSNSNQALSNVGQLKASIVEYNEFYVEMLDYLLKSEYQGILSPNQFSNFQTCCKILCELQVYVDPDSLNEMP